MSILKTNVDEAVDWVILPEGEHQIEVTSAVFTTKEESGNSFILLRFESTEEPYAKPITHPLMLPNGSDKRQDNSRRLQLRDFGKAFDLDPNEIDYNEETKVCQEWIGQVGSAILTSDSSEEYGEQNKIRRFVSGH
jgi:hypothetical protein